MLMDTLSCIAKELNEEKVLWAVGASVVLNHYGLVDKSNDIDILVDIKDINKVDAILKNLGERKIKEENNDYSTEYFYEYVIDGIDVDVMARFIIKYDGGEYEYTFDEKSIADMKVINDINVPLTSLEDWYVLYQVMQGREYKVNIIEKYLSKNGIKNVGLLNRAIDKNLPLDIKERTEKLFFHII